MMRPRRILTHSDAAALRDLDADLAAGDVEGALGRAMAAASHDPARLPLAVALICDYALCVPQCWPGALLPPAALQVAQHARLDVRRQAQAQVGRRPVGCPPCQC